MSSFDIEVRTMIPREQWKHLLLIATQNETTVGALVKEIVRRQLSNVTIEPIAPVEPPSSIFGRRVTDEQREEIKKLHSAGTSFNQISKILGLSPETVSLHATKMGLQKRSKVGRPKKTQS